MRIVYLNVFAQMGGAETSLLQLLAAVRTAQPEWDLQLILAQDGPLAAKAEKLGIPTTVLAFPLAVARLGDSAFTFSSSSFVRRVAQLSAIYSSFRLVRQYTRRLTALIRQLDPDLIHTTGFKMHLLGLWARPSRTPVIWHIHDYVSSRPLMRRLLRWHSRKCAAIVVNSKSVSEDVRQVCGSRRPEVISVYNAVDLEKFSPVGPVIDLDAAAGLPSAHEPVLRVGLLATFAKWKGHAIFLKALSLLPSDLPVRGYVIGSPIYQTAGSQCTLPELRREANRLGLNGRVGFTGFVEEPASAIRALDVVVHASTQPEPFGMVIVEGMACGKAVIASAASGAAEIFVDGQNVLAYPCGDPAALAKCILTCLAEPELRMRLGAAGRRSVERLLQGSRLASELVTIYREASLRAA